MRRRSGNEYKRRKPSSSSSVKNNNAVETPCDSENRSSFESLDGSLADLSRESVGKLLRHPMKNSSVGIKKHDNNLLERGSTGTPRHGSKENDKEDIDSKVRLVTKEAEGCSRDATEKTSREENIEGSSQYTHSDGMEEMEDADWEDGFIPNLDSTGNQEVTIEFDETPDSVTQKPIRRATAQDKELAELVHKVHLLCLLARGRIIDRACDDPLIQAALLSLLPRHLVDISKVKNITAKALHPLVLWFQNNFRIRSLTDEKKSFDLALSFAIENREGTSEEIAALSVALFRALSFTTRFVSILDVASLKADVIKSEYLSQDASRLSKGIFGTSTPMVARRAEVFVSPVKSFSSNVKGNVCETSWTGSSRSKDGHSTCNNKPKDSYVAYELNDRQSCDPQHYASAACLAEKSQGQKRKGDLEFEMQLQMALSSTAVGAADSKMGSWNNMSSNSSNFSSPTKRMKKILSEESPLSQGISTAVGSRRVASPLYWAEVYCSGENLTGKWVHVDAINAIVDGEQKVEAVAAACKTALRYVVAFAGNGAKDVSRRYVKKWYKIASQRVNSIWWDSVLAPLREYEAIGTGGIVHLEKDKIDASFGYENVKAPKISNNLNVDDFPRNDNLIGTSGNEGSKGLDKKIEIENSLENSSTVTRNSLEDMELETRALTEPLPTNQQAYRNHQLYAIEKWLTKYQILHPKGPIVGFCSGYPVYLRTCVQTLKTKERWLREALQVKANELPVKELRRSGKLHKVKVSDDDCVGDDSKGTSKLYGKWQLEPLCLPLAVNGIVPKNERGQVDVWSEKCLPRGTVHLRLPRVFAVAKRLNIDYAPAMVGFEFKNGQSHPVFDGIVVCSEFKDAILEAYAEEREQREAEEKKRNELQALSRWYQLLSSMVTRQRLNDQYGNSSTSLASTNNQTVHGKSNVQVNDSQYEEQSLGRLQEETHETKWDAPSAAIPEEHEHVFSIESCSCDESSVMTKRCHCGFSVQVEEL